MSELENPETEQQLLRALDDVTHRSDVAGVLARVADELLHMVRSDRSARLAWRALPMELYGPLPLTIQSSWVFALRADCTSGAERHPNSIQRFMSYRGSGDMQMWAGSRWAPHRLVSEASAPLEGRWLSIPKNVWHKPVMGSGDWVVVSFHTVPANELIEERPAHDNDPDAGSTTSELYTGRTAR